MPFKFELDQEVVVSATQILGTVTARAENSAKHSDGCNLYYVKASFPELHDIGQWRDEGTLEQPLT